MSFLDYDPLTTHPLSSASGGYTAGGQASLSQIFDAADDQQKFVENQRASVAALYEGIERRNKAILAGTGRRLSNPFDIADAPPVVDNEGRVTVPDYETLPEKLTAYEEELASLAREIPGSEPFVRPGTSVYQAGLEVAQEADERLARYMQSRPGTGALTATFGGGTLGYLREPFQVLTVFAGGGGSAAANWAARAAIIFGKEFVVNAGVQTVIEPSVQSWREKAGLPSGFSEGLKNVLFAGLAGGVLGGAGSLLASGAKGIKSKALEHAYKQHVDRVYDQARPEVPEAVNKALDDPSGKSAVELIKPVRDHLPPEARAAIDHINVPEPPDKTKFARATNYAENPERNLQFVEDARREARAETFRVKLRIKEPAPGEAARALAERLGKDVPLPADEGLRARLAGEVAASDAARGVSPRPEPASAAGRIAEVPQAAGGRAAPTAVAEVPIPGQAAEAVPAAPERTAAAAAEAVPAPAAPARIDWNTVSPGDRFVMGARREPIHFEQATDTTVTFRTNDRRRVVVARKAMAAADIRPAREPEPGPPPTAAGGAEMPRAEVHPENTGPRAFDDMPEPPVRMHEDAGIDDPTGPEAKAYADALIADLDPDLSYARAHPETAADVEALEQADEVLSIIKNCKALS